MLSLLYRVMQPVAIYRGVAITSSNKTYQVFGKTFSSLQDAKNAVDASFIIIANSIKQVSTKLEVRSTRDNYKVQG